MVNIIALLLVGLMGLASSVNAAGFRLAEQDAKATGMGNSFVAVADNASAVWYNPAAITNLEGTNLSLGTVMVMPTMEHKNQVGSTATDKIKETTHIPPHFYATRKLNDVLSLGFGVNLPFGLSTDWAKTSNTRFVATKSEIKAINYNLDGAAKVNDKLSFAAGLSYMNIDATLNSMVGATTEGILEGDGHGLGYNAAVMYRHNDQLNFGANYHSKVKAKLEGDLTTVAITPVKTEITLPDLLQFGAAYKYNEKWLVSVEADYTDWTTYRKLIIKKQSDGTPVSVSHKNWKSVWAYRLGTEYKYSDTWKFRAGTFYDNNPVKEKYFETRVPDTDRVALSVGAGYAKGSITVDVSYMYLMFLERKIKDSLQDTAGIPNSLNGKYRSSAQLPAITVGYKF